MTGRVPRAERAAEAARLRGEGLTYRQIGERMGLSRQMASALICDPDGAKDRARKRSYGGTCRECGRTTDGSNGRAKAPTICQACERNMRLAWHGTASMYRQGCRCQDCREENAVLQRRWKARVRGNPPEHGTRNGYFNYECRCDACKAAGSEANARRYREVVT